MFNNFIENLRQIDFNGWKYIFDTVENDSNLSEHNVIDKIEREIKKKSQYLYKEWQESGFNVDYVFRVLFRYDLYSSATLLSIAVTNRKPRVLQALLDNGADNSVPLMLMMDSNKGNFNFEKLAKFLATYEIKSKFPRGIGDVTVGGGCACCQIKDLEYYDRCLDEVEGMKKENVCDDVTLHTILKASSNELVLYARKGILQRASESDYKSKFPIYSGDLEHQFKIGNDRLNLLYVGGALINEIITGTRRQNLFSLKIAEYLSNEDIENLKKARSMTEEKSLLRIGITCGVIVALIVGIGCSAAGVKLSTLAIISTTALAIGGGAGCIMHLVLKPRNKLNKPNLSYEGNVLDSVK